VLQVRFKEETSTIEKRRITNGVVNMLDVNMGLKDDERLLVVTDVPTIEEWNVKKAETLTGSLRRSILAKGVCDIAVEKFPDSSVEFFSYPSTGRDGVNPGREVEDKMKAANVVLAITTYSLSHTDARENANKAGSRIASMPLFEPEMLYAGGPMAADYQKIARESEKLANLITNSNRARISSRAGTDVTLSLKERGGQMDVGILTESGSWGNLPAGEAYCTPLEGTGFGRVVVKRGWYTDLHEDMILTFENGEVDSIDGGGNVGSNLRELLALGNRDEPYLSRRNIAELGIGTNPNAKRPDNVLEAEKIRGTVHIAIGDNFHMGGAVKADMHEDFIIPHATLTLDDKVVMRNGKLII
jgi:leucyl aminopeptidase (aminopeptidase T)